MSSLKVWIHVSVGDGTPQCVCWYMGTSDAMVENAIRMLLHLPRDSRFLLRDSDGDIVPVSATLPHNQTYELVLMDLEALVSLQPSTSTDLQHGEQSSGSVHVRNKRRRREELLNVHDQLNGHSLSTESIGESLATNHHQVSISRPVSIAHIDAISPSRSSSIVTLVTRFVETFTRSISNDDNVNFIPSTGEYALYALYRHLFQDPIYHPKSQNAFYKMTSSQGKVDRQRVIRHYQHTGRRHDGVGERHTDALFLRDRASYELEYVLYKPEGKGLLLRKYVAVPQDTTVEDLVRAAAFVHVLDLDPRETVAKYTYFIKGFRPISRAEYQQATPSIQ